MRDVSRALDTRQALRYRALQFGEARESFEGRVDEEIVTGAEIGRRLGVSRERVRQWASDPKYGFPVGLGRIGGSKLWTWAEVKRWADNRRVSQTQRGSGEVIGEPGEARKGPGRRLGHSDRGGLGGK